jgi:hypothetical protein
MQTERFRIHFSCHEWETKYRRDISFTKSYFIYCFNCRFNLMVFPIDSSCFFQEIKLSRIIPTATSPCSSVVLFWFLENNSQLHDPRTKRVLFWDSFLWVYGYDFVFNFNRTINLIKISKSISLDLKVFPVRFIIN